MKEERKGIEETRKRMGWWKGGDCCGEEGTPYS